MKQSKSEGKYPLAKVVWSNITRQQYLLGISDVQLCELLGVSSRTLFNYRRDPSGLTISQIQALLDSMGVEIDALIQS